MKGEFRMNPVLKTGICRATILAATATVLSPAFALAAEGEKVGMPQLDTSSYSSQVFWLAITFTVLLILMWKVAIPRVGDVIEAREQKIRADLERAEQIRAEIADVEAAVEKTLSGARSEAQDILRKAQDKIAADHAKKQDKLDADLEAKLADAQTAIDEARKEALASVRDVAGEVAAATIQKLTGKAATAKDVTKALDAIEKGA